MHIGTMLSMPGGQPTIDGIVKAAQQAERAGFASAWLPNVFDLEAITTLAIAGRETQRIELGTAVVPTYPRHPAALAQQALTAQLAARGRFALGIGLSHRVVIEDMFGLDYSRPCTLAHSRGTSPSTCTLRSCATMTRTPSAAYTSRRSSGSKRSRLLATV
ncbi:MAG TPA: LLM class flavin-dependent oxidoreductase [Dehalococcoidia bacterium]|nr:LLM class flavin-dependent oxidoreductase [Dehalococcoidia bacterium]